MDREQLMGIAMRYDTAMSRAMLRALGVDAKTPPPSGKSTSPWLKAPLPDRYRGASDLMAQRHGVCW